MGDHVVDLSKLSADELKHLLWQERNRHESETRSTNNELTTLRAAQTQNLAEIARLKNLVMDARYFVKHIHDRLREIALHEDSTSTFEALLIGAVVEPMRAWLEEHPVFPNKEGNFD